MIQYKDMYDCIIIGAGPAGMTAAIYTARKKIKTLVLSKDSGGQMVLSNDVENYTGFTMVTGAELTLKFQEHLASLKEDLELKLGAEVTSLEKNITSFSVEDSKGNIYYARSVIIASGKQAKRLGIPGEDKFFGKGVSICATCDAPLYKNKTAAVVGGGDSAMDAILALSKVATKIYAVTINDKLVGDEILKAKVLNSTNVELYTASKILEVKGELSVLAITVQPLHKPIVELAVQGVFVEVGYEPSISFDHITDKNVDGEIKVDQNLQTSVPGIFAAGDINDDWGEQIVIAAGEGAKAAMAVSNYLNKHK